MLDVVAAAVVGVIVGTFTGLIPGIHINLVSALLVASASFFTGYVSVFALCCFIIAMSVTHSFLDSIPSIFLGAPEADTALGVLPGHRYVLQGNGMMAVKLTLVGSFGALVLSSVFFPVFLFVVSFAYPFVAPLTPWLLALIALFTIASDRLWQWALAVFALSGTLGYLVLNHPSLDQPLFPLLTGLFGTSTLLYSIKSGSSPPEQLESNVVQLRPWVSLKALLAGQGSGFLTSFLPGIGASTAALLAVQCVKKLGDHGFMVLIGSVNTVNFVLSLATFYTVDKARNGSIVAVQTLIESMTVLEMVTFVGVALFAGGVSVFIALRAGLAFARAISSVDYVVLVCGVIAVLVVLCVVLSGVQGVVVMVTATGIGLVPAVVRTKRIHSMGCLLVPVMLYYV